MSTLIVGFDSAWTATNSGSLAAALVCSDGTLDEVGLPQSVDYEDATRVLLNWQSVHSPQSTLVLLDQPTIVRNAVGQRPVENIVGSPVSLRYGGMQPANTGRVDMFGPGAPVWSFLDHFGGAANPLAPSGQTQVIETYPVLAMISLGWTLPDVRPTGRLPKYNPDRATFSTADWRFVCTKVGSALSAYGLANMSAAVGRLGLRDSPRKAEQDDLDACICLLVALHAAGGGECLLVGNQESGYIVVQAGTALRTELEARCRSTGRTPSEWVRVFQAHRRRA